MHNIQNVESHIQQVKQFYLPNSSFNRIVKCQLCFFVVLSYCVVNREAFLKKSDVS